MREEFKRKIKKPAPSYFDFGPNCFYMTEKIDNYKWNDITNKQLAEKVRKSIQEVDQVLQINNFALTQRSRSISSKIEKPKNFQRKDEDDFHTPSPKGSFHKFRELLKSNNLVSSPNRNDWGNEMGRNIFRERLTGSKLSTKTNCDTEIKEDILRPKTNLSPNLRYKQSENHDGLSPSNKVIITDELKFSNIDSSNEEKASSSEEIMKKDPSKEGSQKSVNQLAKKLECIMEDSLWELEESDIPQPNKSPKIKTDPILFSIKMTEDQIKNGEDMENPLKEETKYAVSKLGLLATQLPLDSISEDVNSPYFASSPSRMDSWAMALNSSSHAKEENYIPESKYTTVDKNDQAMAHEDKNLQRYGTIQTATSVSENYIENANIDTLEQKLEKICLK